MKISDNDSTIKSCQLEQGCTLPSHQVMRVEIARVSLIAGKLVRTRYGKMLGQCSMCAPGAFVVTVQVTVVAYVPARHLTGQRNHQSEIKARPRVYSAQAADVLINYFVLKCYYYAIIGLMPRRNKRLFSCLCKHSTLVKSRFHFFHTVNPLCCTTSPDSKAHSFRPSGLTQSSGGSRP